MVAIGLDIVAELILLERLNMELEEKYIEIEHDVQLEFEKKLQEEYNKLLPEVVELCNYRREVAKKITDTTGITLTEDHKINLLTGEISTII